MVEASHCNLRDVRVSELLTLLAERAPEREALVAPAQAIRWSFAELNRRARTVARGLLGLGIRRGDHIALWANNIPEWVVVQFAAAKIGAVLVTMNTALRRAEVEYLLKQSEARALILIPGFKDVSYLDELTSIVPELLRQQPGSLRSQRLPQLRHVVVIGGAGLPGTWAWEQLKESAAQVPERQLEQAEASLALDDVINMQYTSGTTGFPKGAMLTHRNIVNNGYWVAEGQRLSPTERVCTPVPLFHCFGCVIAVLGAYTHGATLVLVPQFDPGLVLETVAAERCTALYGVPTMFIALLEHLEQNRFDVSSLRTGVMAGSLCPKELMRRVRREMHLPELTIAYGLTEASPAVSQTAIDDAEPMRSASVGRALPEVEVKIVDPKRGTPLPAGQAGELWTRGYHVMKGYFNNSEATRKAITSEGWLRTGDLASMNEQGYLTITGRLTEMIIRGGENIYPKEVEEFLRRHPRVSDAAVYGVPDGYYGEEVAAAVRLAPGETVAAAEIIGFCRGHIAPYKIPRYVKFVEAFPQTASGKIQKFKLREAAARDFLLDNPPDARK
ncbi:MAG: AMP-binding protein [Terriglobia bacterium]